MIALMLFLPAAVLVGLSVFLVVFLVKSDRGAKEPPAALVAGFGFGILGIALALGLEKLLLPAQIIQNIYLNAHGQAALLRYSLIIAAIEETVKFLPLAIFIYRQKYFDEHNDGLIYFALAGVAFGLIENMYYLFRFGSGIGLLRASILLFFHPATCAVVGYFLARHKLDKKSLWLTVAALLGVTAVHGAYNFGLGARSISYLTVSLMLTAVMNASFFLLYRRASELDQASGLAAEGENTFCRHCGQPNPKHFLYCEHCGNQA